jgi:hypothetical protein
MKLVEYIAKNCEWHKTVNERFIAQCEKNIENAQNILPYGSGFDNGCKIDIKKSGSDRVVITTSFHHLNDSYYTGWTEHTITVIPKLWGGFDLRISGKNQNDIKDYIHDVFSTELCVEID